MLVKACLTWVLLVSVCDGYTGFAKTSLKLDCYLGVGFRAGGCDDADIKNHELRLDNLEEAGLANHEHTKVIGEQVNVLKAVATNHHRLHENDPASVRTVDNRRALSSARRMLENFPDASVRRDHSETAWKRVFKERILKPITVVDWLQILLALTIVLVVSFKVYACVRKRKGHTVNINANPGVLQKV